MYILKNAWKSIVRSKGRNILIGIIVMIITVSSCIALSIKNSANTIVQNVKDSSIITATLTLDRQALMQDTQASGGDIRTAMSSISSPTIDDIKKYGTSQYLSGYYYTIEASLNSSNIQPIDTNSWRNNSSSSSSSTQSNNNGSGSNNGQGGQNMPGRRNRGDFRITGYSSASAMTNFVNGTYKMKDGSMFDDGTAGNVCVITDELAQLNNLSVGSTITFTNPGDTSKTYDFKVVGVYTNTASSGNDQMIADPFSDTGNQIITSFDALNNIIGASKSASTDTSSDSSSTEITAQVNPTFILKDADSLNSFKADLASMGLNKYYTVQTNSGSIDQTLTPVKNLSSFATVFLILVLVIGGIILIVLNMINIRERKYEVGVLRAIGMKKWKLAFQFISELFIVTFIAIIIGTAAGSISSVPTANMMLQNQISAQQDQQQQISQSFGRTGNFGQGQWQQGGNTMLSQGGRQNGAAGFFGFRNNVSYVNQIDAVMNLQVLMEIILIGILLTLLSSSFAVTFISRYEPLKILNSRA